MEELLSTALEEPADGTPTESGDEWGNIALDGAEPEEAEEGDPDGKLAPESAGGASVEADKADFLELKHLGETKRVSRDEAVTLAQKGLDYDHVKGEYVQLRETAAELEALAAESGFSSAAEMLDQARDTVRQSKIQSMIAGGVPEETARAAVDTGLSQRSAEGRAEVRRRQEIGEFVREFPAVKPENIPEGVWARVAKGEPLLTAYMRQENKRLQAEMSASRQDRENRWRAPGSVSTAGSRREAADPILAALEE